MKEYIKPAASVLDIDLSAYLQVDGGNTPTDVHDYAKGTDEWLPEEEIDDDEWW